MVILSKGYDYLKGAILFLRHLRIFKVNEVLKDKTVAVIGAADTAFRQENGEYIDTFDFSVRMNRALINWKDGDEKYLGSKCTVLFHNFYENRDTGGGGKLDTELFNRFGVKYLIQSRVDGKGLRTILNFYKNYLENYPVYTLPPGFHSNLAQEFGKFYPTRGFTALAVALSAECKRVFITGFTFFMTPYQGGYRSGQDTVEGARKFIKAQDQHDPDLELQLFFKLVKHSKAKEIVVDEFLYNLIKQQAPESIEKVKHRC